VENNNNTKKDKITKEIINNGVFICTLLNFISLKLRYLHNSGSLKKKYEKSHFMLIFEELLVCRLQKQGRLSLFVPYLVKIIYYKKTKNNI